MREDIAQAMRDIYAATDLELARAMVKRVSTKFAKSAPKFVAWLEDNAEESFTVYRFPQEHWRKIRTSNALERVNAEIKRRTRVATLFPSEASCLRLVTAVLQELHEEWITGKVYVRMTN